MDIDGSPTTAQELWFWASSPAEYHRNRKEICFGDLWGWGLSANLRFVASSLKGGFKIQSQFLDQCACDIFTCEVELFQRQQRGEVFEIIRGRPFQGHLPTAGADLLLHRCQGPGHMQGPERVDPYQSQDQRQTQAETADLLHWSMGFTIETGHCQHSRTQEGCTRRRSRHDNRWATVTPMKKGRFVQRLQLCLRLGWSQAASYKGNFHKRVRIFVGVA